MKQTNKHTRVQSKSYRGSASKRAQRQNRDDAQRIMMSHGSAEQNDTSQSKTNRDLGAGLKITFLGGLADVGEKNMAIIETATEAIVLDCGNNLSVDLPGINYEINDTAYLKLIQHKLKAYVITHGHLDHMGGLRHTVPRFPAQIYGSRYAIGVIEKAFEEPVQGQPENFKPQLISVDLDDHKKHAIGSFAIEFIRVTHSLPDAAAVSIDTPVGKIIATGDFRLDPEPLDKMPSDIARLQQLGDEGVLLLMSDSSYADAEGRVPTESTLQKSFYDIINNAAGRIFVTSFSSNMNRTQMIINAAVAAGKQVLLDGRGMLAYAEIAVRQGILRVPKGTIVSSAQAKSIADSKLLVMCTGGQGERNAALQRMSDGQHKNIKLKASDTVIVSSTPIPGNEISYDEIGNKLSRIGVTLYRHPTHALDGCGPLHVSGHARREELREMIRYTRPKFFIPVHGGTLRRTYHADLAVEEGISKANVALPENGDCLYVTEDTLVKGGQVSFGSELIDQNNSVVPGVVVKDRLMISDNGIVSVILTIDSSTGALLTSPDIISRGFISMRDNEILMRLLRTELKRAVSQRFKRVDIERFKAEVQDHISDFVFKHTGGSPVIIPVVNVIGKPRKIK